MVNFKFSDWYYSDICKYNTKSCEKGRIVLQKDRHNKDYLICFFGEVSHFNNFWSRLNGSMFFIGTESEARLKVDNFIQMATKLSMFL